MLNPKVAALIERAKAALHGQPPLGGSILVNFGADGLVLITEKNIVYPVPSICNANCTVTLSLDELAELERGASVFWAVTGGRLKVEGDENLAKRFGAILTGKA